MCTGGRGVRFRVNPPERGYFAGLGNIIHPIFVCVFRPVPDGLSRFFCKCRNSLGNRKDIKSMYF